MGNITRAQVSRVRTWVRRLRFEGVHDRRAWRPWRHSLAGLLRLAVAALATGRRTLRGMEALSHDLSQRERRRWGLRRSVSDTTLYEVVANTSPEGMSDAVHQQMREAINQKAVANDVFAGGAVSYDGKGAGAGVGEAPNRACKVSVCDTQGTRFWHVFALRSSLVSSSARPCLNQAIIPRKRGEATTFPALFREDVARFPRLFRYVLGDAGLASHDNAKLVVTLGKVYVFQVKGNFSKLYPLAQHALESAPVVAQTTERAQGKTVVRQLRRVPVPEGIHFAHATQLIGIRQVRTSADGVSETEDRVFITCAAWDELSPERLLKLIRLHWGIENGPNWTCDVILHEDTHTPCQTGQGPLIFAWLTLLAYNLAAILRAHLPPKDRRPQPWARVLERLHLLWLWPIDEEGQLFAENV